MAEIREAHARYSAKQLENDKTTRVLEAGFGKEFTKRYMRTGTQPAMCSELVGICT